MTPGAQGLFPSHYDGLAGGLLSLPVNATAAERVAALAKLQDEQGHIAEAVVDHSGVKLVQHNCAVHDVARGMPVACAAELELFRDPLGPGIVR